MLLDLAAYRQPLPRDVIVFHSGSNRVGEIRGFAQLRIPVGVAVNQLNEEAICLLVRSEEPLTQFGVRP
jgi:hypothetical protein